MLISVVLIYKWWKLFFCNSRSHPPKWFHLMKTKFYSSFTFPKKKARASESPFHLKFQQNFKFLTDREGKGWNRRSLPMIKFSITSTHKNKYNFKVRTKNHHNAHVGEFQTPSFVFLKSLLYLYAIAMHHSQNGNSSSSLP